MIIYGGEGKKLKHCCVIENIEYQQKIRESDEIRDNKENSSPMSNTSPKQGSEEWRNHSNVSKTIAKQSIEGSLIYFANGPMGASSPMYKTRSKQGSEKKWWNSSNVSNTIEKQGIEGRSGYCVNGPMRVSSPMSKTRLKLGSKVNGRIAQMCLRQFRSKASQEVCNIAPFGQ